MARTPQLDTGDRITFALSALIRPIEGVRMTVKVAVTGRVRENESGAAASRRIEAFVQERMEAKITELTIK